MTFHTWFIYRCKPVTVAGVEIDARKFKIDASMYGNYIYARVEDDKVAVCRVIGDTEMCTCVTLKDGVVQDTTHKELPVGVELRGYDFTDSVTYLKLPDHIPELDGIVYIPEDVVATGVTAPRALFENEGVYTYIKVEFGYGEVFGMPKFVTNIGPGLHLVIMSGGRVVNVLRADCYFTPCVIRYDDERLITLEERTKGSYVVEFTGGRLYPYLPNGDKLYRKGVKPDITERMLSMELNKLKESYDTDDLWRILRRLRKQ